eukprot:scaffold15146_cov129-Isochrysis_galbana.AAC.2
MAGSCAVQPMSCCTTHTRVMPFQRSRLWCIWNQTSPGRSQRLASQNGSRVSLHRIANARASRPGKYLDTAASLTSETLFMPTAARSQHGSPVPRDSCGWSHGTASPPAGNAAAAPRSDGRHASRWPQTRPCAPSQIAAVPPSRRLRPPPHSPARTRPLPLRTAPEKPPETQRLVRQPGRRSAPRTTRRARDRCGRCNARQQTSMPCTQHPAARAESAMAGPVAGRA